jgi:hypothetical protein
MTHQQKKYQIIGLFLLLPILQLWVFRQGMLFEKNRLEGPHHFEAALVDSTAMGGCQPGCGRVIEFFRPEGYHDHNWYVAAGEGWIPWDNNAEGELWGNRENPVCLYPRAPADGNYKAEKRWLVVTTWKDKQ